MCEFTGLDFEMEIREHYFEVLDVVDRLFVAIFKGLQVAYGGACPCRLCIAGPAACTCSGWGACGARGARQHSSHLAGGFAACAVLPALGVGLSPVPTKDGTDSVFSSCSDGPHFMPGTCVMLQRTSWPPSRSSTPLSRCSGSQRRCAWSTARASRCCRLPAGRWGLHAVCAAQAWHTCRRAPALPGGVQPVGCTGGSLWAPGPLAVQEQVLALLPTSAAAFSHMSTQRWLLDTAEALTCEHRC